ncbi:hypothetical protein FQR65_LT12090 [Abscondita terminalis]|nr:hypothetical protein FQR65_LT12090 [Abscondita terminalis]
MSFKPFISQNTNIFSENKYNSVPGSIGSQPVLITQSSERRVIDQKSLTITRNDLQRSFYCTCNNSKPQAPQSVNVLCGQKEYIPGGISYTFNKLSQYCANQQAPCDGINTNLPCCQLPQPSLTLEQQIALKQLEKQGLELTLLQERLKLNPCKLNFHLDCKTSTSDLIDSTNQITSSEKFPVYKDTCTNVCDQLENPTCLYTSKKKLVLSKTPDLQKQETSNDPCYCKNTQTASDCNINSNQENKASQKDNEEDTNNLENSVSDDSSYKRSKNEKKRKRHSKKYRNIEKQRKQNKNCKTKNSKQDDSEEKVNNYKLSKRCKFDKSKETPISTDCSCDSLNSSTESDTF